MAKKVYIESLAPNITTQTTHKFVPKITTKSESLYSGIKKGITIKAVNFKGLKISIDGSSIGERDLYKLFPLKYKEFHYAISGTPDKNGDLEKTIKLYFPKNMISNHSIVVSYRLKMQEYIFTLLPTIEV